MLWSLYRQARLFFDPRSNLRTPVFFAAVSAVGAGAYWWHSVKRKQEDEFLDAHFSRGNTQEKIKTLEQAYQKAPVQISSLLRRRLVDRLLSQTIAQNAWVLRGDAELFPGPYSGLAYSTDSLFWAKKKGLLDETKVEDAIRRDKKHHWCWFF